MEDQNNQYSNIHGFNNPDIEQKILDRSSGLKIPDGKSREEALSLLKEKIAEKDLVSLPNESRNLRLVYWISSIAAGLLILFGIWRIWLFNPSTEITAERGSHKEYHLPDGSNVTLNADSKIIYDSKHFNNTRHLMLEGEAFFNITQGNNFTISTRSGEIKVLGTSFNIFTRDKFKVSCLTGKILVSADNQSRIIVPGESAELSGEDLISFIDADLSSVTGWLNGEFNFVDSPLVLVFEEIERQFNVKFAGQKIDSRYFTGRFTNKDLRTALEIVCPPMDLKYEIGKNGKIFITERTQ